MLLFYLAAIISLSCYTVQGIPLTADRRLHALNRTTNGRVHAADPLAKPCFSIYQGHAVAVDPTTCADIQAHYTSSAYRTNFYSGFMHDYNENCASAAASEDSQCLLNPANPASIAAVANASCGQGSVSRHYLDVSSPDDVRAALTFARRTGTRLSIKNSGHDYASRSSLRGSLALWTRNLQQMHYRANFIPQGCGRRTSSVQAITVGAGINFDQVYRFADAHNVTFVGGSSPTVGASGGFTMSGGHGLLSSQYGLGVDRVLEFKVVTPDGRLRVANACQHADLFWALRGGGGGTYGVVMESTSQVERGGPLVMAYITLPTADTTGFVELLMDHALRWAQEGWGGPNGLNYIAMVNPFVSVAEAEQSMAPVAEYVRSRGGNVTIERLPSFLAVYEKYVAPTSSEGVGTASIATNRMVPNALMETPAGRATILHLLDFLAQAELSPTLFATTPAYYSRHHPEAAEETSLHPAWRNSTWMITVQRSWAWNSTVAERRVLVQEMKRITTALEALAPGSGSYLAEADPWTVNWQQSWWGDQYGRLLKVKQRYDPHGLLSCWRCVGWQEEWQQPGNAFDCMGGLE
ncbi:FAD-binding domain-containing protein [Aspergillus bertholletiae]|uniref:FAD-binding domain-containing protein n=1 Tax=Aspergillus bertholletiae TaxID=1226010 RepID=A0A5N7ATW2_9EURO|nr:FAD-binding domain-containing protein [Aspergillus bertholletiae]